MGQYTLVLYSSQLWASCSMDSGSFPWPSSVSPYFSSNVIFSFIPPGPFHCPVLCWAFPCQQLSLQSGLSWLTMLPVTLRKPQGFHFNQKLGSPHINCYSALVFKYNFFQNCWYGVVIEKCILFLNLTSLRNWNWWCRLFKQLLLLFSVHQMSSGLFRLIGAVCKTMIMAYTGGSFLLLIVFMLGGYIIPRPAIKSWWIWGYWISPLAYAENAISINEMLAPRWSKVECHHHQRRRKFP